MNPFVEIENVTLSYSDELREPAVQDLSISIEEGEFSAVVAPSGCGKSTLMKLVTGLLFPQAGQVRVDGAQVDSPLKIAGMAFQNPGMLPWRKNLENLPMANFLREILLSTIKETWRWPVFWKIFEKKTLKKPGQRQVFQVLYRFPNYPPAPPHPLP